MNIRIILFAATFISISVFGFYQRIRPFCFVAFCYSSLQLYPQYILYMRKIVLLAE